MTDELVEVTITPPDATWLEDLCHQLVEARLAACAHVIHPVTSNYRWQGAVHQTTEARAFLRFRRALVDAIVAYVVDRHPYDVPNVTALPLIAGDRRYLDWAKAETKGLSQSAAGRKRNDQRDRAEHPRSRRLRIGGRQCAGGKGLRWRQRGRRAS